MQANEIYTLRAVAQGMEQLLTRRGIPFSYDETGLVGRGDVPLLDVELPLVVGIDPQECILTLTIGLPFTFPVGERGTAAQAVCHINSQLTAGAFDLQEGALSVRVSTFFRESRLDPAALQDLLELALALAELYYTPFNRLSLGEIGLERFLQTLL